MHPSPSLCTIDQPIAAMPLGHASVAITGDTSTSPSESSLEISRIVNDSCSSAYLTGSVRRPGLEPAGSPEAGRRIGANIYFQRLAKDQARDHTAARRPAGHPKMAMSEREVEIRSAWGLAEDWEAVWGRGEN